MYIIMYYFFPSSILYSIIMVATCVIELRSDRDRATTVKKYQF